jgi:succinate dehydrogenase / fumarate reductase cytochrome b subunit
MKSSPRPLSPHLQIYKMPLSAKLSILHRLTGLALTAGAVMLVVWLFSLAYSSNLAINLHLFFSSTLGKVILMAWTFAFSYHFFNGIRHLFWDVGKGFELSVVNKTGMIVVVAALIVTALIWTLGV